MRAVLLPSLAAALAGCATPGPIKQLAASTGPLVAETQGTASAVQKRFREQDAVVGRRISYWSEYAAGFIARSDVPVALWSADSAGGGQAAATAKANQRFLEIVHEREEARSSMTGSAMAATTDPNIKVSAPKLILLLDGIAKGQLTTPQTAAAWVRATDKALSDLKKDAEQ